MRLALTEACQILRSQKFSAEPGVEYVARINCAIDHVVRNLREELRLEEVAAVAAFSPFHFHRVFKAMMGETLAEFVKRTRLERAVFLMAHAPKRSLTEVAFDCGFASSSDFSRCFKQHFGVAPSAFDLKALRDSRRAEFDVALDSGPWKAPFARLAPGENPDGFAVVLRDLPPRAVAYIRVLDPYHSFDAVLGAYARLAEWAEARGLADRQWLGYQREDPDVVALADCRYDVALEVDDVTPDGEIGRFDFPAMRVAEVRIAGDVQLETRALDWLYATWLPSSGYEPDDQPSFEAWIGRPFAHGMEHFTIACQIPVRLATPSVRQRS
jgi:AraC family transcriptional regulator